MAEIRLRVLESEQLPRESKSYPRLALALSALTLAALATVLAVAVPPPSFDSPALFAVLIVLGLLSALGGVALNQVVDFDTELVIGLMALVLLGPVPALCIAIVAELLLAIHHQSRRTVVVANIASYGWGLVAAAAFLALAGMSSPADITSVTGGLLVAVAGLVLLTVNYTIFGLLVNTLLDGKSFIRTANREFCRGILPGALPMLAVGVAMVWLYGVVGILALGICAAIVAIPQLLLPVLLRPRPVENLSHADAVVLYSQAIASVLKLDSTMKEVLSDAAQHIEGPEAQANGGKIKATYSGEHFHDVVEAVLYYREHWDSGGEGFAGVGGEMIPLSSRILAVSDQWAQLTASGVWTVTHAQAMNKLQEHSGTEYDPRIVSAAAKVVDEERMGLTDNQPQLHEVPLPQLVRKVPRFSGLLTANRSGA